MRGSQRAAIALIGLIVAAVVLSMLHNTGASVPVEGLVLRVVEPVRSAFTTVANGASRALADLERFGEMREENAALRVEVAELRAQAARLSDAERENERFREALAYLDENPELELVTARIVGRDSLDMLDTIVIDRGASSGIRVGMAVVANGGLAGRVTKVTDTTADILPVHSPQSTVSVLTQGDEATADGTLDGTNGADLVMRHIDAEAAIMVGDPVVTSSLGGSLPRGIPVGRIVAIEVSPTSVLRQAIVEPLVQPERLDVVQVILGQTAGA